MTESFDRTPISTRCSRRRWRGVVMACLLSLTCPLPSNAASDDSRTACETAGREAERRFNLPPRLLLAIGRAESGWHDPQTDAVTSWPWTINAEGRGQVFISRDAALTVTAALQRRGVTSVDVGCFQINLLHHPNAFSSLSSAFDPHDNADYAADFLSRLYRRTGTWGDAVAAYHSTTPVIGLAYRQRVLAVMPTIGQMPSTSDEPYVRVLQWEPPKSGGQIMISTPHQLGRGPSVIFLPSAATVPTQTLPVVSYYKSP